MTIFHGLGFLCKIWVQPSCTTNYVNWQRKRAINCLCSVPEGLDKDILAQKEFNISFLGGEKDFYISFLIRFHFKTLSLTFKTPSEPPLGVLRPQTSKTPKFFLRPLLRKRGLGQDPLAALIENSTFLCFF